MIRCRDRRGMALLLLTCLLPAIPAAAQEEILRQAAAALREHPARVVHDLGRMLKPGGVRELEEVARELQAEGRRVRFVTMAPGSTDAGALAETLYRDLGYGRGELLILFDGRRVYGKTLALEGRPEAFREAAEEARAGFRLYHAKGLAVFAEALHARARGGRTPAGAASTAGTPRLPSPTPARSFPAGMLLLLLAAACVVATVLLVRSYRLAASRPDYRDRLRAAEATYQRITLRMPDPAPPSVNREWLRLHERLEQCRDVRAGSLAGLMDLTAELKALERRIEEERAAPPAG